MSKLPVTGVVMNWRRPENLMGTIVPFLREHLDEVIVLDASGEAEQQGWNFGDYTVGLSWDPGLHARFAAGLLARNERVLIQDDDLVTDRAGLEVLLEASHATHVLHGVFGRRPTSDLEYDGHDAVGECEIVLTRMLMTTRQVLGEFFASFSDFRDLLMSGTPPGNGEDIALSYVAMKCSTRLNVALGKEQVKIQELPAPHAIHARADSKTGHWAHRTAVVRHMHHWLEDKK